MTDLSKPILLGGLAGMFFIVIFCITTTLSAMTFYAGYTYYTAMTLTPNGARQQTLHTTQTPQAFHTPVAPLTAHPQAAASLLSPAATMTQAESTATSPSPTQEILPTVTVLPTETAIPPTAILPTDTPQPTPDFAATAVQATQAALAAAEESGPTMTPTESEPPQGASPEMQAVIQQLVKDGLLQSTKGKFYNVPDYEDTWNTIDWQRWTYVEQDPANFIIRAKASWDTTAVAGMTANSGCGFIFRENGAENYYLMYLGINGRVYLYRMKDGAIKYLGNSIYYPVQSPKGQADIMLFVNGIRFIFGVDGENIYDMMDGFFMTGKLGMTTLSGTAQGEGTTCKMENIELWTIE